MNQETYFTTKTNKVEEIIDKNKHYNRIFMNIKHEDGKDILYLTKDKGQDLYIVSSENYDDIFEYFTQENKKTNNKEEKVEEIKKEEKTVKRKKQGSLLNFFKKAK